MVAVQVGQHVVAPLGDSHAVEKVVLDDHTIVQIIVGREVQ